MFENLYVLIIVSDDADVSAHSVSTNRDVLVNIVKDEMKDYIHECGYEEFDESCFKDDGERLSYTSEGMNIEGYLIQEADMA